MQNYNVYVSEPAENDFRDIVRYISSQLLASITAVKMIETIEEALLTLENMPYSYPLVTDERLNSMGYHKLIVKNYVVFFTIDENYKLVNVERILYSRRDWLSIL